MFNKTRFEGWCPVHKQFYMDRNTLKPTTVFFDTTDSGFSYINLLRQRYIYYGC